MADTVEMTVCPRVTAMLISAAFNMLGWSGSVPYQLVVNPIQVAFSLELLNENTMRMMIGM